MVIKSYTSRKKHWWDEGISVKSRKYLVLSFLSIETQVIIKELSFWETPLFSFIFHLFDGLNIRSSFAPIKIKERRCRLINFSGEKEECEVIVRQTVCLIWFTFCFESKLSEFFSHLSRKVPSDPPLNNKIHTKLNGHYHHHRRHHVDDATRWTLSHPVLTILFIFLSPFV